MKILYYFVYLKYFLKIISLVFCTTLNTNSSLFSCYTAKFSFMRFTLQARAIIMQVYEITMQTS